MIVPVQYIVTPFTVEPPSALFIAGGAGNEKPASPDAAESGCDAGNEAIINWELM